MKFKVMACTAEEYAKANTIPGYAPQEYEVGTVYSMTEVVAQRTLERSIRDGHYPPGSVLVRCDDE